MAILIPQTPLWLTIRDFCVINDVPMSAENLRLLIRAIEAWGEEQGITPFKAKRAHVANLIPEHVLKEAIKK